MSTLERMERKADCALWEVAPDFARSLGVCRPRWSTVYWFDESRYMGSGDSLSIKFEEERLPMVEADEVAALPCVGTIEGMSARQPASWPRKLFLVTEHPVRHGVTVHGVVVDLWAE